MGFLDMFRQKDADPEIQKLQDSADASKSDPNPHVALALAYVDQFRTPPHWSESYAKKAIKAFHKAIAITAKFTPVQEEGVRNAGAVVAAPEPAAPAKSEPAAKAAAGDDAITDNEFESLLDWCSCFA